MSTEAPAAVPSDLAPEPTPAVERAARVLDPDAFALRSPATPLTKEETDGR